MEFRTKGYETMELSTQILIKEALKRELQIEVLDREDNFILIKNDEKEEYVKQATKTSKDSYISHLIMENKNVSKIILDRAGINSPKGGIYYNVEEALLDYEKYKGRDIVIKPNSTNYGTGVYIFKKEQTKADYIDIVKTRFNYDKAVIIEEFIKGREFRYLVIDNKLAATLCRVPANVIGDGKNSIKELVEIKNRDPLRGEGHKSPLEKIKIGETEMFYLKSKNLDENYIPKNLEQIFLRENTNISTGGDSIDFTGQIDETYSEIAIKAAKAVGAKFCGVDLIIEDIENEANETNHSVLELNFNPAIHMHCFPAEGKRRDIGSLILDCLGF